MRYLPLFFLLFNLQIIKSQSLSIDETINYINELSKQSGQEFEIGDCLCKHNQILKINNEGLITITEYRNLYNCKSSNNRTFPTYEYSFQFGDIDLSKIQIDKTIGWIVLPCKNSASNIRKYRLFEPPSGNYVRKEESLDKFTLSIGNDFNKQKFLNAYKYLFYEISTSKNYQRIDNDPFSPANYNQNTTSPSNVSNLSIPLNEQGGVYTTDVMIGTKKFRFILDSGAGEVNISSEVEQQLVSSGLIAKSDYLISGLYRIADGSVIVCRRVKIKNMKIGGHPVYNVTAAVGGYSSPLLLGRSFLNKFKKWTIDNQKSLLIIEK